MHSNQEQRISSWPGPNNENHNHKIIEWIVMFLILLVVMILIMNRPEKNPLRDPIINHSEIPENNY